MLFSRRSRAARRDRRAARLEAEARVAAAARVARAQRRLAQVGLLDPAVDGSAVPAQRSAYRHG